MEATVEYVSVLTVCLNIRSRKACKKTYEFQLPEFPEKPNHPTATFKFPSIEFGKKNDCHTFLQISVVSMAEMMKMAVAALRRKKKISYFAMCVCAIRWKKLREKTSVTGFSTKGYSLLKLRAEDDSRITTWMEKKTDKHVSRNIQNELLKVIAVSVLRDMATRVSSSPFFSVMADECTDQSNREQLAMCIRWIDEELEPQM